MPLQVLPTHKRPSASEEPLLPASPPTKVLEVSKWRLCATFVFVQTVVYAVGFVRNYTLATPWMNVSETKACSTQHVNGTLFSQHQLSSGQGASKCKLLCQVEEGCRGINFFQTTQSCTLWKHMCGEPLDDANGASSYKLGGPCLKLTNDCVYMPKRPMQDCAIASLLDKQNWIDSAVVVGVFALLIGFIAIVNKIGDPAKFSLKYKALLLIVVLALWFGFPSLAFGKQTYLTLISLCTRSFSAVSSMKFDGILIGVEGSDLLWIVTTVFLPCVLFCGKPGCRSAVTKLFLVMAWFGVTWFLFDTPTIGAFKWTWLGSWAVVFFVLYVLPWYCKGVCAKDTPDSKSNGKSSK